MGEASKDEPLSRNLKESESRMKRSDYYGLVGFMYLAQTQYTLGSLIAGILFMGLSLWLQWKEHDDTP